MQAESIDAAPQNIQLEFLHPNGQAVIFRELGEDFIKANNMDLSWLDGPVRVAIAGKPSQAGNTFYEFSVTGLSLPDGLQTLLRIEGNLLPFEKELKSKSGNPTRKARTEVIIGGHLYIAQGSDYPSKRGMSFASARQDVLEG
ncbi:hypothetical protein [Deinococcus arenicola]|uniref:Uncharacterized protein n=1 Tax=Deinococcus arenicola TaxID=2994950 RepID=A0ABU4DW89_9DEIO|nr:hypothetical protein [Deinococcus sp. ZS9-10]MDV6376319.1 hypothetical protein [Deinococcus sp. ZS9-10]